MAKINFSMKLRYWIIIATLILVPLLGGVFIFWNNSNDISKFETEIIERKNINQTISLTGNIKPVRQVDLAFEKTGKVSKVMIDVGEQVNAGDFLIGLTNQDLNSQFFRNQAILEAERAQLKELKAGTRSEEINIQDAQVTDNQLALQNTEESLINSLKESYITADSAVSNGFDKILEHPNSQNAQIAFITNNFVLEQEAEQQRRAVELMLNNWKKSLDNLNQDSNLQSHFDKAQANFSQIRDILNKANILVKGASTPLNPAIPQSTFDNWHSAISSARTSINSGINSLTVANQQLKDAKANLNISLSQLESKQAGATENQINIQKAKIKQAKAEINNTQTQITKTILRSPISGTVSQQEAKIGQLAQAGSILVSIISDDSFEIETFIPEADITKVNINNKAEITLDAYGPDINFGAQVIKIAPAETIIDGVVTYKTTLSVDAPPIFLKSGMTANIDLITAERKNIIAIPRRAIFTEQGKYWVELLKNNQEQKIAITTGLLVGNGLIEIKSGLKEGDQVITFTKE